MKPGLLSTLTLVLLLSSLSGWCSQLPWEMDSEQRTAIAQIVDMAKATWKQKPPEGFGPNAEQLDKILDRLNDLRDLMDSEHGGADDNIFADFFRCCRTGDSPRTNAIDGRLSVQVAMAARESCDTGKVVEIK